MFILLFSTAPFPVWVQDPVLLGLTSTQRGKTFSTQSPRGDMGACLEQHCGTGGQNPLPGLGATRQKSLGTRRHGQSLSEPQDSEWRSPTAPSPHHMSHPRRQNRTLTCSGAPCHSRVLWTTAPHGPPPQSCSPLGAGTGCPFSFIAWTATLGEMVAGKAGSSSGFSCPSWPHWPPQWSLSYPCSHSHDHTVPALITSITCQ